VPTALAVFPHENFIPLRHIAGQTNNIVQWTEFDRGGHFPAMEAPDLLVTDIRAFFRKIRRTTPGQSALDRRRAPLARKTKINSRSQRALSTPRGGRGTDKLYLTVPRGCQHGR
jgi:hypothetical protein